MADDLTNQVFDSFNMNLRVRWNPVEQHGHVLSRFLEHSKEFHNEMKKRKAEVLPQEPKKRKMQKDSIHGESIWWPSSV